jgi:hypothetical protein
MIRRAPDDVVVFVIAAVFGRWADVRGLMSLLTADHCACMTAGIKNSVMTTTTTSMSEKERCNSERESQIDMKAPAAADKHQ